MKKIGLIVLVFGVIIIAGVCVFALESAAKRRAESQSCASSMAALCLAARIWAEDNGGVCASDFRCMSNELSTVKILICPSDRHRQRANDWASLTPEHCSYQIVSPGLLVENTNTALVRCTVHGYLGYTDGTVFDGVRRRHKYD